MASPERWDYESAATVIAIFSVLPTIVTFSLLAGIGEGIHIENPELKSLGVSAITYPLWFLAMARACGFSLNIRRDVK